MLSRLPESVDPWRLADRGEALTGSVELASLERLATALLETDGVADFELRFGRDENRRVVIGGYVRATLPVECQRCLGRLALDVDATLSLGVIEVAAEAERVPEHLEPVQADDGMIRPLTLVEDELLLAIPQVPMHAAELCTVPGDSGAAVSAADLATTTEERNNPFAVLAGLKTGKTE